MSCAPQNHEDEEPGDRRGSRRKIGASAGRYGHRPDDTDSSRHPPDDTDIGRTIRASTCSSHHPPPTSCFLPTCGKQKDSFQTVADRCHMRLSYWLANHLLSYHAISPPYPRTSPPASWHSKRKRIESCLLPPPPTPPHHQQRQSICKGKRPKRPAKSVPSAVKVSLHLT